MQDDLWKQARVTAVHVPGHVVRAPWLACIACPWQKSCRRRSPSPNWVFELEALLPWVQKGELGTKSPTGANDGSSPVNWYRSRIVSSKLLHMHHLMQYSKKVWRHGILESPQRSVWWKHSYCILLNSGLVLAHSCFQVSVVLSGNLVYDFFWSSADEVRAQGVSTRGTDYFAICLQNTLTQCGSNMHAESPRAKRTLELEGLLIDIWAVRGCNWPRRWKIWPDFFRQQVKGLLEKKGRAGGRRRGWGGKRERVNLTLGKIQEILVKLIYLKRSLLENCYNSKLELLTSKVP